MKKKITSKIINFPTSTDEALRQVESILFAAEEPLDIETIKTRIKIKADVSSVLSSLENQYKSRGINLVCIK